ncbi:NAD(P)-binding protein [Yeosuana sp. MJ-SS3]|uniref:NAD(P)-binding protein n=1 Tax=Gilvirhabdus luticola TaxID=3079858 RepID=A0ABU3U536_9FLAO|nr:NAD(P)-binding protein [Yeosuana sp. MJ-SS3]MDU8885520.1 NAD(P)-binding protein [Yeosuana sp. MJ-SS3]
MKIGVVGGSIAGCSAAILLLKEGYDVTVFERSNTSLVGRGGGIGTPSELIKQIKQDGLIPDDFSFFQINRMPFIGKNEDYEPYGKIAWEMPMNFHVFQWNELWRKLRNNLPNKYFKGGIKITNSVLLENAKVELTTNKGKKEQFDLVVFADGYNSLGRSLLFPEKKLKYRGYVLWRGLLPESEILEKSPLKDEILRLSYKNQPGHNVLYFIPNKKGSTTTGSRIFNWAAYIAVQEKDLNEIMTDVNGRVRNGTLPPGKLTIKIENKLKHFLSKKIPEHYADIVNKTTKSYIQVIYTLDLDSYYKNNMCLIGDAGIVVQPFTGSGVFKGYNNIKDLIVSLKENNSLKEALKAWNKKQLITGKKLLALGEQMEKAFIWEQPDFANTSKEDIINWWKASVTFPDNFNYGGSSS